MRTAYGVIWRSVTHDGVYIGFRPPAPGIVFPLREPPMGMGMDMAPPGMEAPGMMEEPEETPESMRDAYMYKMSMDQDASKDHQNSVVDENKEQRKKDETRDAVLRKIGGQLFHDVEKEIQRQVGKRDNLLLQGK